MQWLVPSMKSDTQWNLYCIKYCGCTCDMMLVDDGTSIFDEIYIPRSFYLYIERLSWDIVLNWLVNVCVHVIIVLVYEYTYTNSLKLVLEKKSEWNIGK